MLFIYGSMHNSEYMPLVYSAQSTRALALAPVLAGGDHSGAVHTSRWERSASGVPARGGCLSCQPGAAVCEGVHVHARACVCKNQ